MKPVLSVALLFVGVCLIFGGTYSAVSLFVFWKPGPQGVVMAATMLAIGAGLVFAGSQFWDRWAVALAAILILAGVGSIQTRAAGDDPTHGSGNQTFRITGGILAAGGAITYLLQRRRR